MRGLVGLVALAITGAFVLGIGCTEGQSESESFCSSAAPYSGTPDVTEPKVDPPPFFVAFGSDIVTSIDGVTWSRQESSFGNFNSAAYGDGRMIAYGGDFGGCFGLSENGAVWTELVNETFAGRSFALAHGAGRFVAVGPGVDPLASGGSAYASTDGVTWADASGEIPEVRSVTHGGDKFVAVGTAAIAISSDGLSWTSAPFDAPRQLFDVAHGAGVFVAVGNSGSIFSSVDGVHWSEEQSGLSGGYFLRGVTYGDGLFVAVGDQYDPDLRMNTSMIITSPDGAHWTTRHSGVGQELRDVVYGNGRFVVVGQNETNDAQGNTAGTTAIVLNSLDGIHWTTTDLDEGTLWLAVVAFWPVSN